MQVEHFPKHEDRSSDRGAYADLTNFHAGEKSSARFPPKMGYDFWIVSGASMTVPIR
jgi:hypothetical protein